MKIKINGKPKPTFMKNILLRSLAVTCILCTLLPLLIINTSADIFDSNVSGKPEISDVLSVYVYNIENDREIVSYNGAAKISPGPFTKIMSFIIVAEMLGDRLDERITVEQSMLSGTYIPYMGIEAGEVFTVKQLMYIAFCGGFNDAVNVLAAVCCETRDEFVAKMNEKASELGVESTVFTNPTGVHNSAMYTTMSDLALIFRYACTIPLVLEITNTEKMEIPATETNSRCMVYNSSMLISGRETKRYLNEYAKGLFAGNSDEIGRCVATLAVKNGLSYLCIVYGGKKVETDDGSYDSAYKLINELIGWSFDSFGYVTLFDPSVPCADITVKYSLTSDTISVLPADAIALFLPLSFDPKSQLDYRTRFNSAEFEAPLSKNDVVGKMTVLYEGEPVGEVELILTADVERDEFLSALDSIKEFSKNRVFILSVVCAIAYSLLFLIASALLKRGKAKNAKKKK